VAIAHRRHERRGAKGAEDGVRGGGILSSVGRDLGRAVPPLLKIFVILHFKWCIWRRYFHVERCVYIKIKA